MISTAQNQAMSVTEKAQIKRALIGQGVNPSGMDDDELRAAYADISAKPAPKEAPKLESVPDVTEEKPKKRVNAPKGDTKTKSEVADFIERLMNGGVDESRIIELIKEHAPKSDLVRVEVKEKGEIREVDGLAHKLLPTVIKKLSGGVNVYLAGPAGSGKTTIARQCAQAFDIPFHFTGAIFQKYELTGFIDANGNYQTTPFREAFEHGGLLLWDEIDASASEALVAFNAGIGNGIYAFPDKTITAHPDFKVMAAGNTKGKGATREYNGRNALDGSSLDRFVLIDIDYDEILEEHAAHNAFLQAGGDDKNVTIVEEIARAVRCARKKASDLRLTCIISPRATIDACKLAAVGFTIGEALKASLWGKLDETVAKQLGGE